MTLLDTLGIRGEPVDRDADRRITRSEATGLAIVVIVYLAHVAEAIWRQSPIGHDESVYALRARDYADGWLQLSGYYWEDYRAPGVPLLLTLPFRVAGELTIVARSVLALCGLAVVLLTWAFARRFVSRGAAVAAAASLVVSAGFLLSSSTVLADVPGVMFVLAAALVFTIDVQRRELRWSLVVVPLLVAAAVITRYGAPLAYGPALAVLALTAVPDWWRSRAWGQFARLAGLAVVTVVITYAVTMTTLLTNFRSPLDANARLTGGKGLSPATGWSDLWDVILPLAARTGAYWDRTVLFATVGGLAIALLVALAGRRERRGVVIGLTIGVITLIGLVSSVGLVVANYLVAPAPFFAIGVGVGWAAVARAGGHLVRRALGPSWVPAATAVTAVATWWFVSVPVHDHLLDYHRSLDAFETLTDVSQEAGRRLEGRCLIVSSYTPQVGWESGCDVTPFRYGPQPPASFDTPERFEELLSTSIRLLFLGHYGDFDASTWDSIGLLVVDGGKRQPPDTVFADIGPLASGDPLRIERPVRRLGSMTFWRLDNCAIDASC